MSDTNLPQNHSTVDQEIDIHGILEHKRMIGHLWVTDDVRQVRPHLNDDEAWVVLQTVEQRLNSDFGINWDIIQDVADELYPEPAESTGSTVEPTNGDRAQWAKNSLAVFTAETFGGDHPDTMNREDLQSALSDLICDLLHYASLKDFDTHKLVLQSCRHFAIELSKLPQP